MTVQLVDLTALKPQDKVLGLSGSPRKNGNSDILLKTIMSGVAKYNIPEITLNLKDIQFTGCIGCEKCRQAKICTGLLDGMTALYPEIYGSKGLVLVSPTHNYNITSWMKAFIDRLYCFYTFENNRPRSWSSQLKNQNRKTVVAAICEQESAKDMGFTIDAMKKPLEALGYEIIGEMAVLKVFDKGRVKHEEHSMNQGYELGRKLGLALTQ